MPFVQARNGKQADIPDQSTHPSIDQVVPSVGGYLVLKAV